MPTTLADIARELGVSMMTVSRANNNHPEINTDFLYQQVRANLFFSVKNLHPR